MLYTISLKTNIKKRILINLSLLGPEFKPPDYHHFVLLNKEKSSDGRAGLEPANNSSQL